MQAEEVKRLAMDLSLADFHAVLLAMIDIRMDEEARTPERGKELAAVADACVAFETVVFPVEA